MRKSLIIFLLLFVAMAFMPIKALAEDSPYDVTLNGAKYSKLEDAVKAAKSGDTITLGEGHYSLYKVEDIKNYTKGKDLTFVGKGTDKTFWGIGAEVPDPSKFGTEYNGDYSFDGAEKVTFKNMTLQSSTADYLGFIRADHTVVEDSIINGKTFYWGYKTATFKNTVFNAPKGGFFGGDYALWTYSSPVMTFDGCTFNSYGKTINVYSDYLAQKTDFTINFRNCTVNSNKKSKPVLNINDSNKDDKKIYINISGTNTITGNVSRDTAKPTDENHTATCTRWFGFGGKQDTNNTGRTVVKIDDQVVFENGKMAAHEIDTANDKYTEGYKDNAYDISPWEEKEDINQYARVKTCNYCKETVNEKGYKLSYNPNGGMWENGSADMLDKEIISVDQPQQIEKAPTRKGFAFIGWKLNVRSSRTYQPDETYDEKNQNNEFINANLVADWNPIINTVTFKDGNATYANVKVENGKTIDSDDLPDESMPQNPTKNGYTFEEWNTQQDGKGTSFTGETVVNEDIIVYAIYAKNVTATNEKPNDNKPQVSNTKTSPGTGDRESLLFYAALVGFSGAFLVAAGRNKRRKES